MDEPTPDRIDALQYLIRSVFAARDLRPTLLLAVTPDEVAAIAKAHAVPVETHPQCAHEIGRVSARISHHYASVTVIGALS